MSGDLTDFDLKPFVKIQIHGHPSGKDVWFSQTSPDDELNPVWNEVAEFNIQYPENAIIEFIVSRYIHTGWQ